MRPKEKQKKQKNQNQNQKKKKKGKNQTTPVIANAATATAACKASSRQASRRNDIKSEAEANLVLGARRQMKAGRSHNDADAWKVAQERRVCEWRGGSKLRRRRKLGCCTALVALSTDPVIAAHFAA
jgi:hypothetical protein